MNSGDPFDLDRFIRAQAGTYAQALAELHGGHKRTHWMWFVFPQVVGLGHSAMSRRFGITGLDEARAYLAHPVLGARLRECSDVVAASSVSAHDLLGSPDDLKLRSCMTLFYAVGGESCFSGVLASKFDGTPCTRTLELLAAHHPSN